MLIDSHVNLHSDAYQDDLDDVLLRAEQAGVRYLLTISDKLASIDKLERLTARHDNIWHSVGVHPHYAVEYADLEPDILVARAEHPKAIGIGECGLDYHYEYSARSAQLPVFEAHIAAAQKTGLPLIIHTREADEDMAQLLRCHAGGDAFTPLMHCYTSGMALARLALDLGGYIAFSGILTFKNADEVREVAQMVPLDRLIIETDCPYLAPVPQRGRRNEPAFLGYVAHKLAEIKNVSPDEMIRITGENFLSLFSRAQAGITRAAQDATTGGGQGSGKDAEIARADITDSPFDTDGSLKAHI